MMSTLELDSAPAILPLYARAVAPLLPGASRLPWVGGNGGEIPEQELVLTHVRVDPARVADYSRVCGFTTRAALPATYPHVLAFPLHLALMADGRFPFPAVGLVHLSNRITQHRPIGLQEELVLRVHAAALEDHPRGQTFSIVSQASVGGELVWEELSTMLHRGQPAGAPATGAEHLDAPQPPVSAQWRLEGDLGRRYAAVSGDRNPIHLHALTAKLFGFPRAIAHGMWTKARCLAALEESGIGLSSGAFRVDVRFRRPILLPATVSFGSSVDGETVAFAVRASSGDVTHLDGRAGPAGQGEAGP
jgi:acyl dehydratase